MSKKAIRTKELTSEEKIEKALKSNTKINELKLKRDLGDLTPEVLEMCKQHVDQMLEITKKNRSVIDHEELEKAAEQIKNDQELLVLISQFADVYDEVLVWNKLIRQKKLDMNVTARHREMDIAFYNKIVKIQREKKYSIQIHTLILCYGYRNDK